MKTQKEYIRTKGTYCPLCSSSWTEWEDYPKWVKRTKIIGTIKCLDCKGMWEEIYKFKRYIIIENSDEEFEITPEEG